MRQKGHRSPEHGTASSPTGDQAAPWAAVSVMRRIGAVLGVIYLLSIWLDAFGTKLPERVLPRPLLFFTQVAELFPYAAIDSIEWRARGWRCDLGRFEEIDVRPLFLIRQNDKESRFDRAMFFHHRQRNVLEPLDHFITSAENRMRPEERIGGVVLMSLRIPIPPLGEPGPRRRWMHLDEYPPSVERRYWYTTAPEARTERCLEAP